MIIRWEFDAKYSAIANDARLPLVTSELLRAHRLGHHLLVIERPLISELIKLDLSSIDRATLTRLSGEFTQNGAIHRQSKKYIIIENSFDSYINIGEDRIHLSLFQLNTSRILEPSVLLVENSATDGWFLETVLKVHALNTWRGGICFDLAHGGGDEVPNVLESLVHQKKLIVTLVDSDKNSPTSTETKKIDRLEKVVKDNNWKLSFVYSSPCREVENFIPLNTLLNLPCGHACGANEVFLNLEKQEEGTRETLYMFFDLKLGWDGVGEKMTDEERKWIKSKLALAGKLDGMPVPGYGEKIIKQIKADGAHITTLRQHLVQRSWSDLFLSFFEGLWWYFIAAPQIRT